MGRPASVAMITGGAWILTGCVASPIETPGPVQSATPSPAATSGPSASAVAPSRSFAATGEPLASGPIAPFDALPIALREQAWVRIRRETDASGEITAVGIEMGLLGAAATTLERRTGIGPLRGFVAGPYVALENPPRDDTQPWQWY